LTEEVHNLDGFNQKPKRPFLVTVLAVVVLSITIVQLMRFINSLVLWDFLTDLLGAQPLYLALTGLIWFILGLVLFWGLWRGKPRAPLATRILGVIFLAYQWIERFIFASQGNQFENWQFMIGMTLLVILFIFWTLSRSDAKTFFGEMHESSS
jgi:hypothetical protein